MPTAGAPSSNRRREPCSLSPCRQLHRRGDDLPAGQPPAQGAAEAGAHQAQAARPLGHGAGDQPDVRGAQPIDPGHRRIHPPGDRTRPRRAREPGQPLDRRLSRGRAAGAEPRRRGPRKAGTQLLLAGRLPEPSRADRSRDDPRGRRTGVRARHGVRRRARQPGPDRRVHRWRRRGRDRPHGRRLALEQVPRPRDLRCGSADAPPERLQDRQPDDLQVDERRGADEALRGLRLAPADRRGRGRPRRRDGRGARHGLRGDPRAPGGVARLEQARAAALADARGAHAQGLDRSQGGGRGQGRGHLQGASGPRDAGEDQPRAPQDPRGVAALLRPGGAVRRRRRSRPGDRRRVP